MKKALTILSLIGAVFAEDSEPQICIVTKPNGSIQNRPKITMNRFCGDPIERFNRMFADSAVAVTDYTIRVDNQGTAIFEPKEH